MFNQTYFSLFKGDKLIARGIVNNQGNFVLSEVLDDGIYSLSIESNKFEGKKEIIMKGYRLDSICFEVFEKH